MPRCCDRIDYQFCTSHNLNDNCFGNCKVGLHALIQQFRKKGQLLKNIWSAFTGSNNEDFRVNGREIVKCAPKPLNLWFQTSSLHL